MKPNKLKEEIERHKLNIERTNIDIKKEAHQRMVELLEAELKGRIEAIEDAKKIIDKFFRKHGSIIMTIEAQQELKSKLIGEEK